MTHLETIERFFAGYAAGDLDALRSVTTADLTWRFPGRPPLGGVKTGLAELLDFLDRIAGLGIREEKIISGANDNCVLECKRIRRIGSDREMTWCLLWVFRDGRICSGTHFTAEPDLIDEFFLAGAAQATSAVSDGRVRRHRGE